MKTLVISFFLVFILSTNAVFAPLPFDLRRDEEPAWSALFPEFPGCEREIQPITRDGETFIQTAVYTPLAAESNNPPLYHGCGTIALVFDPSAQQAAKNILAAENETPFFRKRKIKSFDAFVTTPLCGNDDSRGSIRVYFDVDKILIVSAKRGAGDLLEYAETADYELLKQTIDEFFKSSRLQVPGRISFGVEPAT